MNKLRTTPLGEVLFLSKEQIELEGKHTYKQITIRLNHKGVAERGKKKGAEILSKQFVAKRGQFIISRIDARNGAMGLVPKELHGAIVTNDFLLFDFDKNEIDLDYLNYLTSTKLFDDECKLASEGTTNRVRLKLERFLSINVVLPSLPIQKAIVKKLDEVKSKTVEIASLRLHQQKDFETLAYIKYLDLINDVEWMPFAEVSPVVRRSFEPETGVDYIEIGIRSFGNGTFQKPPVKGKQIAHKDLYKIKAGDLVFSNVFSWEGAIALAKPEDDICIGSHRFITTVPDGSKVNPEFLLYHLLSPRGLEDINKASPGTAGRNKTLGVSKLEKILVPAPDIELQNEFAELLHKITDIKKIRTKSDLELKALFPSVLDKAFKGEW